MITATVNVNGWAGDCLTGAVTQMEHCFSGPLFGFALGEALVSGQQDFTATAGWLQTYL
jgi:hypothetical protein